MNLRESFREPFLQLASQRQERIVSLVRGGDDSELRSAASELHALSGEASMLDFGDVADLARHAEVAARSGDRARLAELVTQIQGAIDVVAQGGPVSEQEKGE